MKRSQLLLLVCGAAILAATIYVYFKSSSPDTKTSQHSTSTATSPSAATPNKSSAKNLADCIKKTEDSEAQQTVIDQAVADCRLMFNK